MSGGLRSSLAPHVSRGALDPAAARRMAREAFQERGFVAIDPAWISQEEPRRQLIEIAETVHGKRRA